MRNGHYYYLSGKWKSNHNKISYILTAWIKLKTLTTPIVGKDVEQLKVSENEKWYNIWKTFLRCLSYKIKHKLIIWANNSTLRNHLKEMKIYVHTLDLHVNIHSTSVHNILKLETPQWSLKRQRDKQDWVYPSSEILYSYKNGMNYRQTEISKHSADTKDLQTRGIHLCETQTNVISADKKQISCYLTVVEVTPETISYGGITKKVIGEIMVVMKMSRYWSWWWLHACICM